MTTSHTKLTIAEMSIDDRPREKVIQKGFSALTNSELIAILLRTGNPNESVLDLSKRILRAGNDNLNALSQLPLEQLTQLKGIGQAKAITLMAAFELGKRCRCEEVIQRKTIQSPQDVLELMQDKNAYAQHEEFWVIYLSQSSQILHTERISQGGITSTVVDIRLILKQAINLNATCFILCHNHPSGNLNPSAQDRKMTSQMMMAAEYLSLKLLDHIIIHQNRFYSMNEMGNLI